MRPGDKVRFLDDVGEATVLRLLGNGMAEVEDEHGIVHPHPMKKLVVVSNGKEAAAQPVPTPAPIAAPPPKPEPTATSARKREPSEPLPELALVFLSENDSTPESADLELYFHNGSDYHMLVNIAAKEQVGFFSLFSGEVRSGEVRSIRPIRRQDVDIFSQTVVDCIFFKEAEYEPREAFSITLKLKAVRFAKPGCYRMVDELGGQAVVVPVERQRPQVAEAAGTVIRPKVKPRPVKLPEKFEDEIDLHIEHLTDRHQGMANYEMLQMQLGHFERHLNHAIASNYVQIVFIHGVGKGRLRDEIRKRLSDYDLRFEDGSYLKYGFGATVVLLRG
jgi:hypothetical protein